MIEPLRLHLDVLKCFQFLAGDETLSTDAYIEIARHANVGVQSIDALAAAIESRNLPWTLQRVELDLEDLWKRVCPSRSIYYLIKYDEAGTLRWGLIDAFLSRLVRPTSRDCVIQTFSPGRRSSSFLDHMKTFFLRASDPERLFPLVDVYALSLVQT